MNSEAGYCGLLLAAGRSTRFGSDKLLHPLPDGTPIVLASARALRAVLPQLIAVVARDHRPLIDLFAREGIRTVPAPADEGGMGASLAAGVAAAPAVRGWLVALADMPFVRSETVAQVAAALQRGAVLAAPTYRGRRGHPVGFDRRFRDELLQLHGDEGARGILQRHSDSLELIECGDSGIIRDIDRPSDLVTFAA